MKAERKKIEQRIPDAHARGVRVGHGRLPVWEFDTPAGRTLVVYGELDRATATLRASGVLTWVGAPRHVGWWDGSRVEMFEPGVQP